MKKLNVSEAMAAFDPIDRADVVEPKVDGIDWESKDYFAWSHPSGHKTFIVVSLPERDVGLVLRADGAHSQGMCDICYGANPGGTTLATVDSWSNPRKSMGIFICKQFECSEGVRGLYSVDQMRETIPIGRRIERLQMNLERFVRSVIDKNP